jgi:hypothetical protein
MVGAHHVLDDVESEIAILLAACLGLPAEHRRHFRVLRHVDV